MNEQFIKNSTLASASSILKQRALKKQTLPKDITATVRFMQVSNLKSNIKSIKKSFLVYEFEGSHDVNALYEYSITIVSDYALKIEDIVDTDMRLFIQDNNNLLNKKSIYGKVFSIRQHTRVAYKYLYVLKLVHPLYYLSLNQHYTIFQNKNAIDIIKTILMQYQSVLNITVDTSKLDITKYPVKELSIQYEQSDLEYLYYLLQQNGLVMLLDTSSHEPFNITITQLSSHPSKIVKEPIDTYYKVNKSFSVNSMIEDFYDNEKPSLDMNHEVQVDNETTYKDNDKTTQLRMALKHKLQKEELEKQSDNFNLDLKRTNKLRGEEAITRSIKIEFTTDLIDIEPSQNITLTHTSKDNLETIITKTTTKARFPSVLDEYRSDDSFIYDISVLAVPSSIVYRPPLKTKPISINSIQTAIVIGDSIEDPNSEQNQIELDSKNRIPVRFHFDKSKKVYLPLSNLFSGTDYGIQFLPRVNQEVIVSFINGNINRPVITRTLYNQENANANTLPDNKTRSYIKTFTTPQYENTLGFNEIAFEDKQNRELLSLRAQKDHSLEALNDSNTLIGNNKDVAVNNNYTNIIQNDLSTKVMNNQTKDITNNKTTIVGSNQTSVVQQNSLENVLIAKALSIGAGFQTTVGGAKNESVGLSSTEQVGVLKHIVVGDRFELNVGSSHIELNADGSIIIDCKGLSFNAADTITLAAPSININSAGPVAPTISQAQSDPAPDASSLVALGLAGIGVLEVMAVGSGESTQKEKKLIISQLQFEIDATEEETN